MPSQEATNITMIVVGDRPFTHAQRELLKQAMNCFCESGVPFADDKTLPFFAQNYAIACVNRARVYTVEADPRLVTLNEIQAILEAE